MSNNDKLPPPEKEVRRDLWPEMTLPQLKHQQDLILDKMSLLSSMIGPFSPPHIKQLYDAHNLAYNQLSQLIENKSSFSPKPGK